MTDPYAAFPGLRTDRPSDGVLRITIDASGLNAVTPAVHRELADIWLTVDRDSDTRVALLRGAGEAFSSGGSFELLRILSTVYQLPVEVVDSTNLDQWLSAVSRAGAVLLETPSNPLMRLTDLTAAADAAHAASALLIVDNTFATPFFQRPFEHGADIVFHSTTKYLNGHSDMIGGIALLRDDDLAARLEFIQNASGAVPGPFDCWLALRGTKTLHLRMPAHDRNGRRVASWLAERIGEEHVIYPGLPSHPQHDLAKRQMCGGFGGMISVEVGSRERAATVLGRTRVFSLAESLGGVESLISHPAMMTHASVPEDRREALGLSDGLIRLSCGVEDTEDLIADLEVAFAGL